MHFRALDPKRTWYQHKVVEGEGGGGVGRRGSQRGDGERGLYGGVRVERVDSISRSCESSVRRPSRSLRGWGSVTAAMSGGAAVTILSAS